VKTRWIGLELRKLNNMLRRNSEFSSHRKEIETVTGNNGWIIGFLSENIDAGRIVYRETDSQDGRLKKILLTEKAEKIKVLMREDIENIKSKLCGGGRNRT
jgi:MarR family transcriptional regulator, transcriptional regulator for hemolysin